MNSLTFAFVAPGVSVCGMMISASAITVSFCAGDSTFGVHGVVAAAAAW